MEWLLIFKYNNAFQIPVYFVKIYIQQILPDFSWCIVFLQIIDMTTAASKPDLRFSLKHKYKTNPTLFPIPPPCMHKMYCIFWGRLNIVNPRTCDFAGQPAPSPRALIATYLQLFRLHKHAGGDDSSSI